MLRVLKGSDASSAGSPHILEDLERFGITITSYSHHFGYEHRYARMLNKHEYNADITIFSRGIGQPRILRHVWGHNIKIIPVKGLKALRYARLASGLARTLSTYELVHCFSYYSNIFDLLAISCLITEAPLVAQSQGIYPSIAGMGWLRKFLSLRMADKLLPLTRSEALFLMKRFRISGDRIEVIPNFITPEDYVFTDRSKARQMLEIHQDEFAVLTVCRLVPEKGVQTLIRAAAMLRARIPRLKVIVVGEGPYRSTLEGMASELGLDGVVRFAGFVHNKDIGLYYSAADCFVLASFEESFGIVLLEAMLYGLPVIASRTWGAQEIVDDTGAGILFSPGDELSLSRAIESVYTDVNGARRMGELGKRLVIERFAEDKIFKRLERTYREVC